MTQEDRHGPGAQYDEIGGFYVDSKREHFLRNFARDPASQFIAHSLRALRSGAALIDVGCGQGDSLKVYRQCGFKAHGIDPSHKSVETAKSLLQDTTAASVGTWDNLASIPDRSQDAVTGRFSLHYAPNIDDAFREVARVLKPGQSFIFTIPHPDDDTPDEELTDTKTGQQFVRAILFRETSKPVTIQYPYHRLEEYCSPLFKELFTVQKEVVYDSTARNDGRKGGNRIYAVHAIRRGD